MNDVSIDRGALVSIVNAVQGAQGAITLTAIGDRLAGEVEPINLSSMALHKGLDLLVEQCVLERELLPGQRSIYRIHPDAGSAPVARIRWPSARAAVTPKDADTKSAPVSQPAKAAKAQPRHEPPKPAKPAANGGDARMKILGLLRESSWTSKDLGTALGMTPAGALYHLHELRKAGQVVSVGGGNATRWQTTNGAPAGAVPIPTPMPKSKSPAKRPGLIEQQLSEIRARLTRPVPDRIEIKLSVLEGLAAATGGDVSAVLREIAADLKSVA